ncbi:MAG: RNA methyltransferase [Bacteroidetes bacterium]|nr:RNA methyltransferase [Bacteroidota bacterium]
MLEKSQAKYIQSLSQKKFRDQEQAFIAEGPKIINELLLAANIELLALYAIGEWVSDNPDLASKIPKGRFFEIKEKELERVSNLQTPNQVVAVFKKPVFPQPIFENKISLLLDGIQDPGNMGTLLRTADWFGIGQVICNKETVDVFNTKVVQSTMGSIARVQVIYEDLEGFLKKHPNLPVYATELDGKNLFDIKEAKACFVLIGNESKGVRPELSALASEHIMIPKFGMAESLNAAVAAGIVLGHLLSANR